MASLPVNTMHTRVQPVRAPRQHRSPGRAAPPPARCQAGVTIRTPAGAAVPLAKDIWLVGSGGGADLVVAAPQVLEAHARLEWKAGRLYCTALGGDPDALLAPTWTWLGESELRPGVQYLVAPGTVLRFGTADAEGYTVEFEERSGGDAMAQMLLQGMASGASKEVQDKLNEGA